MTDPILCFHHSEPYCWLCIDLAGDDPLRRESGAGLISQTSPGTLHRKVQNPPRRVSNTDGRQGTGDVFTILHAAEQ